MLGVGGGGPIWPCSEEVGREDAAQLLVGAGGDRDPPTGQTGSGLGKG